ncbi:hypothetical protein Tco_0355082 [Tanacetum coccineum]
MLFLGVSLEDSLCRLIDEVIWKAFRGNIRDLDSIWEKRDKIATLHEDDEELAYKNNEEVMFVELIKKYDDSSDEELEEDDNVVTGEELGVKKVVLGKPFVELSNMTYDLSLGIVKFTNESDEIAYKMPHKIEKFNSLSDLEKEHTSSVYFRNEEDKKRGVDYVMNKILGFYNECLELRPEYLTRLEGSSSGDNMSDEGVTTVVIFDKKSPKVLRIFTWTILG